jgi:ABC-type glycerol-3-phosphate transport system substrate-binding protein
MRKITKITAILITLVLLAACGGRGGDEQPTAAPAPTPTPAGTTQNNNEPDVPEDDPVPTDAGFRETPMDLGGRTVVIFDSHSQWFNYHENIDLTPNETIHVIELVQQIGLDYNATIEVIPALPGGEIVSHFVTLRAAGDTPYDMVAVGTTGVGLESLYTQNIFMDLNHASVRDIIDIDNNPWDPESSLGLVSGRQFGVHFKVLNSGHLIRSITVFNRTFMETFNLPNLYDMVFNMTWTWDAFESMGLRVIQESGGTVFPLTYNRESQLVPAIVGTNGGRFVDNTPEGYVFVAHEDENTIEALGWFQRMIQGGIIRRDTGLHQNQQLADGIMMFHFVDIGALRNLTRQDPFPSDYNFGMLPMPRGPQMNDYASVSFAAHTYHIVNDIQAPEQVAAILVAMANRLTRVNIIDHELNYGVQDMESARVLEMLLDKVVIDHSRVIGAARSRLTSANQAVESGSQTPVAALQAIASAIQANYDAVVFN